MANHEKVHKGQVRQHTRARVGSPPIHVHNLLAKSPAGVQRDIKLVEDIIDNPEFRSAAEKGTQRALQSRLGRQFSRAGTAVEAAVDEAKRLISKESMDKFSMSAWKKRLLEGTLGEADIARLLKRSPANKSDIAKMQDNFEGLNKLRESRGQAPLTKGEFFELFEYDLDPTRGGQSLKRKRADVKAGVAATMSPASKLYGSLQSELRGGLDDVGFIPTETAARAAQRLSGSKGMARGPNPLKGDYAADTELYENIPKEKWTPDSIKKFVDKQRERAALEQNLLGRQASNRLYPYSKKQSLLWSAVPPDPSTIPHLTTPELKKTIRDMERRTAFVRGATGEVPAPDVGPFAGVPEGFIEKTRRGTKGQVPAPEVEPKLPPVPQSPPTPPLSQVPANQVPSETSLPTEVPKQENRLLKRLGIGAAVGVPTIGIGAYGIHRLRGRNTEE